MLTDCPSIDALRNHLQYRKPPRPLNRRQSGPFRGIHKRLYYTTRLYSNTLSDSFNTSCVFTTSVTVNVANASGVGSCDATKKSSYCGEVLLKFYVLQLAVFRVWLNHAVQIPVSLILRHQPTMFLYIWVQLNLCFHQLTVHTLSWYDIYRNEYPDMISISTSKHALTLNTWTWL